MLQPSPKRHPRSIRYDDTRFSIENRDVDDGVVFHVTAANDEMEDKTQEQICNLLAHWPTIPVKPNLPHIRKLERVECCQKPLSDIEWGLIVEFLQVAGEVTRKNA